MGLVPNSSSSSTSTSAVTASSNGKRNRDPEDEVYIDNLQTHKRYLSEIMASSLNGLTVGDSLTDCLMDSPSRDETPLQYSPMSEDSDESRYCESPVNTCPSQPDSVPTSPVSPYRHQRFLGGFSTGPPTTCHLHSCNYPVTCPQPRQRGSDSEGRFPSSPSDICHSADLRRAALMRSVQMRTQSPGPSLSEMSFSAGQEAGHNIEAEERACTYMKTLIEERENPIVERCPTSAISEFESREKPCRVLNMNLKGNEDAD